MEDILTKNVQQIIGAGAGTILSVGFVVGLYLAYKLLNKYLDKRRADKVDLQERKDDVPGNGNGKGSTTAKLIIMQEIQTCQQRHENRIREMETRIIETVKDETREVHRRVDRLHELLVENGAGGAK